MNRAAKKVLFGAVLAGLFLLPFFSWLSAEPIPYRDPDGLFTVVPPSGWKNDDSGHMGKGVVMKGPAGESGIEPVVLLTYETAGIVTIDVMWHTRLGQLRYDLQSVKFRSLEDHEDKSPPYDQARYSYRDQDRTYLADIRLVMHDKRFFFMTAVAPEEEFETNFPAFKAVFDSFRPGGGG
jgi:hypothetical protein